MAFMIPQYDEMSCYRVETTCGTEIIPSDVGGPTLEELKPYLEGKPLGEDPEIVSGWFCRLSAPGYMDCTEWSGPFETEQEARDHVQDFWDVDPDTGEDLAA